MTVRKKKTASQIAHNHNPNGTPENLVNVGKYHSQEIYDEVEAVLDVEDYDGIVSWALKQPYSKLKFCKDKASDLPAIVKNICSAILADIQYGRSITLQMALERLKGKPIERQVVHTVDDKPRLIIEVSNAQIENDLTNLLADEDDKDVRKDS